MPRVGSDQWWDERLFDVAQDRLRASYAFRRALTEYGLFSSEAKGAHALYVSTIKRERRTVQAAERSRLRSRTTTRR